MQISTTDIIRPQIDGGRHLRTMLRRCRFATSGVRSCDLARGLFRFQRWPTGKRFPKLSLLPGTTQGMLLAFISGVSRRLSPSTPDPCQPRHRLPNLSVGVAVDRLTSLMVHRCLGYEIRWRATDSTNQYRTRFQLSSVNGNRSQQKSQQKLNQNEKRNANQRVANRRNSDCDRRRWSIGRVICGAGQPG